jgi:hypothetical protein
MITRRLALTSCGLPFAPPFASVHGSRLLRSGRMTGPNLTMKSWLVMRCSS